MSVRCNAVDLVGITARRITDEGFLLAPAVLARAGNVQEYSSRELGLPGENRTLRLYRPPEEVSATDSVASFESGTITFKHPTENVNAKNWKLVAVGDVRDVKVDGVEMKGQVMIRDHQAVRAVLDGTSQISNGYSFELDAKSGTTPDGVAYDGIQRQIRGNHTAIVPAARGGVTCRIADHFTTEEPPMSTRTIVLDGVSLDLESTQASLVEKIVGDAKRAEKAATDAFAAATKEVTDARTALKTATDATTKLVADHAAVVADLTAKILKPEQIEALAAERAKVVGDAALLCPEFKPAGKTVPAIRAEVLATVIASDEALKPVALAVLGGVAPTAAADPIVRAAFDAVIAARGTRADDGAARARDAETARAFAGDPNAAGQAPPLRGRDLYMSRLQAGFAPDRAAAK